jgi:hypothetical protein
MNLNSGSRIILRGPSSRFDPYLILPLMVGMLFWSLSYSVKNACATDTGPSPQATHGFSIGESESNLSASPTPEPSLFPPRSPAIPTATPLLSPTVTPRESKSLLKQYGKALDNEMAALKHRQKAEMKELKAAHKAQLAEWEAKERQARHKFFADHKTGPERRAYIQDYAHRRDILLKLQSDDEDQRAHEQSVRLNALQSEQSQKLKEFQEYISHNERPPAQLWPN